MVRDSFDENKQPAINIISRIISLLFLAISVFFIFKLSILNFLPTKYFFLIIALAIFLNIVLFLISFHRRTKKITLFIYDFFAVILSIGMIFGSFKIGEINTFIKKNFDDNKKYAVYNVIVSEKSSVNELSDLKGSELFTYEEPVKEITNDELREATKNVIADSTLVFREDLDKVMNRVTSLVDTASVVNNGTYESYISVHEDYEQQVKIVGEIKIEIKSEGKVEDDKETLANTPFLLLISGIDTRTGTMPSRSLSDVNIVAAVNPKAKKILLVAIPRDSYVQLHGISGLPDKLTHAGSRGGVELTKTTIEDFLDIEFNRYIRVNFNFVTELVDNIGGITVTNDLNRTLYLDGCTYRIGDNNVNGKCALRFARERKSYESGDRHRGENQEQVITRIIEKISSDKNLVLDYNKILNSLDGSFDSDIDSDDISALVKMQLDDMSSWTVESYNINGSGAYAKTNSYPGQDLYVMMTDANTVNTAKEKIKATLNATK